MIVFASDFVDSLDPDINKNSPFIGIRNEVSTSNIISTTAQAGYPVTNLANPSTSLLWKGNALLAETIEVATSGSSVDYVAINGHNFFTAGVSVTIRYELASSGTFITNHSNGVPTEDGRLIIRFAPRLATRIQIVLGAGTVKPQASCVYIGEGISVKRRLYVGHTPINFGRVTKIVNGRAENGAFLGRVMVGEGRVSSVDLQNLPADWYRSVLDPFLLLAQTEPFFWAWRPLSYPGEDGFVWITNDPQPSNQRSNGMMQVSFEISGVAQ